jgi:hypothetical protein
LRSRTALSRSPFLLFLLCNGWKHPAEPASLANPPMHDVLSNSSVRDVDLPDDTPLLCNDSNVVSPVFSSAAPVSSSDVSGPSVPSPGGNHHLRLDQRGTGLSDCAVPHAESFNYH